MNIKNQLSTAVADGLQRGSGLRRTLCLLALVAFYAVGAKADVTINATNFPDANFRNWVLAQDYGADGKLTDAEIAGVPVINVANKSIADLTGIGYFTALTVLLCYDNHLTSLDVSKNTEVSLLYCENNKLTSLDVSKNTALSDLRCYNNQIQGAGMATLIETLPTVTRGTGTFMVYEADGTDDNRITTVQVAAAKKKGWDVLTSGGADYPGVDPGIAINKTNFPDGNFRTYVSSNCDTDKDTYLSDEEIAAVTDINVWRKSISDLKGIEYFTALTVLWCHNNQLTSLDVSKNTALEELFCGDNKLTSLDVSKNTALTDLRCYNNPLTSLDLSKNTALKVLICYGNQLTSLDVSKNKALTDLLCYNNQIRGAGMATLINSLPEVTNSIFAVYDSEGTEGNEITTVQVAAAEKKGWDVLTSVGDDYPGVPGIAIDATNFPDEKFRAYVSSNCDADKDTYLSDNEIAAVTRIDVSTKSISSLKGIEYFTALTVLYCDNNKLTSLAVSKNTALTRLDCYINQLTSLDLSNNTALTYLSCHDNPLISLDVSKNTALTTLNCGGSPYSAALLTSLDVSKNTALTYLNCQDNLLTSLDVSGCTELTLLVCFNNQLTKLDVSNNTALTELYCSNNQLTVLDVSGCTALTRLVCYSNKLTSLDVSNNTALTALYCYSNQIRGAGMATLIENLPTVASGSFYAYNTDGTDGNRITTVQVAAAKAKGWKVWANGGDDYAGVDPGIAIDATNFPDGNFRTYVSSNCDTDKDTYLSDDEIAAVTDINVWRKSISDLKGIEYFTALTYLDCGYNELTSLDVSNNTALTNLTCSSNQLTSLDVSKNTALTELDCGYNRLTSLDLSKNTALTGLRCDNNPLTTLDVSKNTALKQLYCYGNLLTSLDVSGCTALTTLWCYINQLTTLDVSKNTALKELWCFDNQLTSLDVSKNTVLTELNCYNNQIQGAGMATLIENLPTVTSGNFYVYNTDGTDGNRITTVQVAAAKAKHWNVKTIWGDDYPGVDIPGDANGDGEVNAQDVDCLRDYILGLDPTPFSLESANLNGDGAVDIVDLTLLIEMLKD